MPDLADDLRSAALQAQIPVLDDDDPPIARLAKLLTDMGAEESEFRDVLLGLFDSWQSTGDPGSFTQIAKGTMRASASPHIAALAGRYFDVHEQLTGVAALSFEDAGMLLAYSHLIGELATRHEMSAAAIAEHLKARGSGRDIPWRAVGFILSGIQQARSISDAHHDALLRVDTETSLAVFADADWRVANELVGSTAKRLGYPGDVGRQLARLRPEPSAAVHWPYLHILHFSLVPLAHFDHPPEFVYEFNPRGNSANKLFVELYRAQAGTAASPFVNNIKGLDRIGLWWADSRIGRHLNATRDPALALVEVLRGIGSLSGGGRRELAALVRQWCIRQVDLATVPSTTIPSATPDMIADLISAISAGETSTRGVLEQRAVDALAAKLHPMSSGWRPRGLGDSVNAANAPRRKLGDCEFQDSGSRTVAAFEAHAGRLSSAYVNAHLASLERIIRARLELEWGEDSASTWSVVVTFVAHEVPDTLPESLTIHGVAVTIGYAAFEEFLGQVDPTELVDVWEQWMIGPLNRVRTPEAVRGRYLSILEDR